MSFGGSGTFPHNILVNSHLPRTTGSERLPGVVNVRMLAWVRSPARWLLSTGTCTNASPETPVMP
jgi:hypothetical protein